MKKEFLAVAFFLISIISFAQETNEKLSNFSLGLNFSLGNSMLNTEDFKNLNGSVFSSQLDISYDLPLQLNEFIFWRFGLGIETVSYNTNLFFANEQSSLYSEYLKVPLKISAGYHLGRNEESILSNTKFIAGLGAFLNYVYKYEVANVQETTEINDVDLGFGYFFNLGLEQDVSERFSAFLGLDYSLMGDNNESNQLNFNTAVFYIGARYRL